MGTQFEELDSTQILQQTELPDSDAERIRSQIRRWRECLLDQTARNPLLKLEGSRASRLQVITPEADALFRILVIERRALKLPVVKSAAPRKRAGAATATVADTDATPVEPAFRIERGEIAFAAGA